MHALDEVPWPHLRGDVGLDADRAYGAVFDGRLLLLALQMRGNLAVDAGHRCTEHHHNLPASIDALVIVDLQRRIDDSVSGEDECALHI